MIQFVLCCELLATKVRTTGIVYFSPVKILKSQVHLLTSPKPSLAALDYQYANVKLYWNKLTVKFSMCSTIFVGIVVAHVVFQIIILWGSMTVRMLGCETSISCCNNLIFMPHCCILLNTDSVRSLQIFAELFADVKIYSERDVYSCFCLIECVCVRERQ